MNMFGFHVVLVVLLSSCNEVKVVRKHSWYRSSFLNLNYPGSDHQVRVIEKEHPRGVPRRRVWGAP